MIATLYFHQGWTDIINCLPLINYFSPNYRKINLIIREDSKPMIDFYIKQFSTVEVFYFEKSQLDNQFHTILPYFQNSELLFFGIHDMYRKNNYVNSFLNSKPNTFFVEKFYTVYDIDYISRISSFSIERNISLEEKIYNDFITNNGKEYILYHEDEDRNIILDKSNFDSKYPSVNLDKKTYTFFDYIKVLENAKEIHLLDSVWAAIIYLLDCKYGIFSHIPIKVNCLRGYKEMFTEPVKLNNWEIINK